MLLCKGKGLEQKLIFLDEMINYGPILPHSAGDEKEVIVKNPCDFPIEFYSVDFDTNYLEEEKVRKIMLPLSVLFTLLRTSNCKKRLKIFKALNNKKAN